MIDALLVRRFQRFQRSAWRWARLVSGDGAPPDAIGERRALHELHHQSDGRHRPFFQAVDCARCSGGSVRQGSLRFPLEAGDPSGVAGDRRRQHLDGDGTLEPLSVARLHTHPCRRREQGTTSNAPSRDPRGKGQGGAILQRAPSPAVPSLTAGPRGQGTDRGRRTCEPTRSDLGCRASAAKVPCWRRRNAGRGMFPGSGAGRQHLLRRAHATADGRRRGSLQPRGPSPRLGQRAGSSISVASWQAPPAVVPVVDSARRS